MIVNQEIIFLPNSKIFVVVLHMADGRTVTSCTETSQEAAIKDAQLKLLQGQFNDPS